MLSVKIDHDVSVRTRSVNDSIACVCQIYYENQYRIPEEANDDDEDD